MDVAGQDDNLGDSVLRRGLLEALRAPEVELHVHTGDNTPEYVAGLLLRESDVRYQSRSEWRNSLLKSVARRRTSIAIDPGEIRSDSDMNFNGPRVLAAAAAVRARGGAVIHAGIGLRATSEPRDSGTRMLARISSVTTWRDEPSRDRGRTGRVAPDWAFSTGPSVAPSADREFAAITMRGDRGMPDTDWLDAVHDVVDRSGRTPLIYSQVHRDNDLAQWIASQFPGARLELWEPDVDHAAREIDVRSYLAQSSFVISDRVHALIIGATEGAVPVGFARQSAEKLARTLEGGGISGHAHSALSDVTSDDLFALTTRHDEVSKAVQRARRGLADLTAEIRAQLAA